MPEGTGMNKSWWSRPENKGAIIPLAIAAGAVIMFGSAIGAFIVQALTNMIETGIMVGAILTLVIFHKEAWYIYRGVIRWLMHFFIEMDPIGIRKTYREEMQKRLDEFDSAVQGLNTTARELNSAINKNQAEIEHQKSIFTAAIKNPTAQNNIQKGVAARQVDRLTGYMTRWANSLKQVKFLIATLTQFRTLCDAQIQDLTNDIQAQELDLKVAKSTKKGVRGAWAILRKSGKDADMDAEASAVIQQQYDSALGEMDHLLDITKDMMATSNLEDEAAVEKMTKMLTDWSSKNGSVAFGGKDASMTKADIIQQAAQEASKDTPTPILDKIVLSKGGDDETYAALLGGR